MIVIAMKTPEAYFQKKKLEHAAPDNSMRDNSYIDVLSNNYENTCIFYK